MTEVKEKKVDLPKTIKIEVENPSAEDMADLVTAANEANQDAGITFISSTFRFRKSKDDETGAPVERLPVDLIVPKLETTGLLNIIEEGGKALEMLLDAANSVLEQEVRSKLTDDTNLNYENFPVEDIEWSKIAAKPKATRGGGIPKEVWEEFYADYLAVMPEATGKPLERVKNAVALIKGRFNKCQTNKKVLAAMQGQLAIYADSAPQAAKYEDVLEALFNKLAEYMERDEDDMLEAL